MERPGVLHPFAHNVWIVKGPDVRDVGVMFTTRMTIVKLSTGSLWVESPVPVPFDTLERIVALGPVDCLVAATPRHVWRLDAWHTLFPKAQLWCARPSLLTLRKGRLPFTGVLGNRPPAAWARDLDQVAFAGNPLIEEVLFYHRESRTVILDDLIQNHPPVTGRPVRNALLKAAGVATPYGGVPADIRLSFFRRDRARRSLDTLLSWDFDKAIIAHGACVETGAKAVVARAFRWLAAAADRTGELPHPTSE